MSKALIHSNIHLQDAKKREKFLDRNVRSSSAVEGIMVDRDTKTGRYVQKKPSSDSTLIRETSKSFRSQR